MEEYILRNLREKMEKDLIGRGIRSEDANKELFGPDFNNGPAWEARSQAPESPAWEARPQAPESPAWEARSQAPESPAWEARSQAPESPAWEARSPLGGDAQFKQDMDKFKKQSLITTISALVSRER